MKIAELSRRRKNAGTLRERILEHVESHPDEVYSYRDDALARAVRAKVSAVSFTLWALHRDRLIDKEGVEGKMFFGSRRAVARLRKDLGIGQADAFERARANREQIARRVGRIDATDLLDSVRGHWQ